MDDFHERTLKNHMYKSKTNKFPEILFVMHINCVCSDKYTQTKKAHIS